MNYPCFICGLGAYVPPHVMTNHDMEKVVDTTDEWITSRTGIRERHLLSEGQNASDCGAKAARAALDDAGVRPDEVTHLFVATCTPDYLCPSTACIIAAKLGISPFSGKMGNVMCMDFNAACTGFIYGLELARSIVRSNSEAVVLLVAAEALSRRTNFSDRSTCVLFGDAAGAIVVRAGERNALWQIQDVLCASDGTSHELITIGGGSASSVQVGDSITPDWFISMKGMAVFRQAVHSMTEKSRYILGRNGMDLADIDLFISHQANLRIISAVGERLGLDEKKVFSNVHKYGNTSSASIPLAMEEGRSQGVLLPGMKVLLTGFGGGMTMGAALLS